MFKFKPCKRPSAEQLSLTGSSLKTPWKLQDRSGLNGPGLSLAELDGSASRDTEAGRGASAWFHLPSGAFNAGLTALRAGPEPGRAGAGPVAPPQQRRYLRSARCDRAGGEKGGERREPAAGPGSGRHPPSRPRAPGALRASPGAPPHGVPSSRPGRAAPHGAEDAARRSLPPPHHSPKAHLRPAEPARPSALPPPQPPPRAHPAATGPRRRRRHLPSPACDLSARRRAVTSLLRAARRHVAGEGERWRGAAAPGPGPESPARAGG